MDNIEVSQELEDYIVSTYAELAIEVLPSTDEQAYERLLNLSNDEDYELAYSLKNASIEELAEQGITEDIEYYCAQIYFNAADGSLKNDVHCANFFFPKDYSNSEGELSILWFPED